MIESHETEQAGAGARHYLDVIRRRKWIILVVLALTMGAAAAVSILQKPVYRASTKIVIGQGGGIIPVNTLSASGPLSATMKDLLSSYVVAQQVVQRLGLEQTPESLLGKMSVSAKPDSTALKVAVTDHSRAQARAIAAEIGTVFSELVKQDFGKPTPVGNGQTLPGLTATVFDPAHLSPQQVAPRPKRNIVVAGVLGLIIGLLAGFLRDHFDQALRNREDAERAFGIPVIGQIPSPPGRSRHHERFLVAPFGESAEAYRGLRANLQYLAVKRPLRTILVTSPSSEEGKTTVTANLAAAIARSGASTIALDADLRRPRLDEAFGVPAKGPGLTSILVGSADLEDAIQDVSLFQENGGAAARGAGQLSFVPSGPLPPNPSELLSSLQMTTLLDHLGATYDYVLIDSPPVLVVADALELTRAVDGVVLIARRNQSTSDQAKELRALVERFEINLIGSVLTDAPAVSSYYVDYADARETESEEAEPVGTRSS